MGVFGLLKKQVKKRLRMKRRWLALGVLMLGIGVLAGSIGFANNLWDRGAAEAVFLHQNRYAGAADSPDDLHNEAAVTLRRVYVCGEEEKALGIMPPERIVSLAAEHPEWEYEAAADGKVLFTEHVDDLSEACKQNTYIGVDADGNVTMFDGPPREERAVKTFFQLNIKYLESALPQELLKQLYQGIRISDIAEYNSVLSTLSEYARDDSEKVMKPER